MDRKYVKISFPLEQDEDGYPPESCETMWAIDLGDGQYRIDNIPFYVKLLSDADIVSATAADGELVFDSVIHPSPNCTVRVLIKNLTDEPRIRNDLKKLGCRIEGTGTKGFIAISLDRSIYPMVSEYLNNEMESDVIDFEESSLR